MREYLDRFDLRLARAKIQAQRIADEITNRETQEILTTHCEFLDRKLGYRLILDDFSEIFPQDKWGLDIGECIHNLRSSLDNLAYALACLKCDPPDKPGDISFPVCQTREAFDKARRRIQQLPDEAIEIIEALQPFQRDGSPDIGNPAEDGLLFLHNLDIVDKHRVQTAITIPQQEISNYVVVEFENEEDVALSLPPDVTVWADPLKNNCVLIEHRTKTPIVKCKGTYSYKASITIVYNGINYPIRKTLLGLVYYMELIIDQFRSFFTEV